MPQTVWFQLLGELRARGSALHFLLLIRLGPPENKMVCSKVSRFYLALSLNPRVTIIRTVLLDIEMKNNTNAPNETVDCRSSRKGMVAWSASRHWRIPKAIIKMLNPTRRPTTSREHQGYLLPPHCNPRNRQHTAPSSNITPSGSSRFNFSLTESLLALLSSTFELRPMNTRQNTAMPRGRFLGLRSARSSSARTYDLHPEAPPPASTICQGAPEYRAKASADAEAADNKANIQRALIKGRDIGDY